MLHQGRRRGRRAKPANREAAGKDCKGRLDDMTLESVHGPRANPRARPRWSGGTQGDRGSELNVPPHGALGGFALTTATLVASTPTSSSGGSRLGDGGRGASETVCVKERVPFVIGVGRRLRGTRGLRGWSGGSGGSRSVSGGLRLCRGSVESASNA